MANEKLLIFTKEILKQTEPNMCSYFGCGRQLTLHESLCGGNKCTTHQRPHIITVRNFNSKKKFK